MIQQKTGVFISAGADLFSKDAGCEDVDAVFFDADGNGSMDLYVVSGGNQYTGNNDVLLDRLYLNDGKGKFTKSINSLPKIFANKSCVAIADADHDGDNDIFVGNLADAKAYGIPQSSFLLLNNGKGIFSPAPEQTIPLSTLGIVTSAVFADVNNDGWSDLVVAGEWMPLTVFINSNGSFKKKQLPNSTGLWQSLFADDVNGDGHMDILAGNWGFNNKFYTGKDGPLKLYAGDFDKNGKMDQLLSYTSKGIEYPFLAKDAVERQLPLLRKHYLFYSDYGNVPMDKVFYGWIDNVQPLLAERLGSALLSGNGKGDFIVSDLPDAFQLAPVFTFAKSSTTALPREKGYLMGGNFFNVIPFEGRYDAQALSIFRPGSDRINRPSEPSCFSDICGEVRDLKWIRTAHFGEVLLAARNNDSLLFFRPEKHK